MKNLILILTLSIGLAACHSSMEKQKNENIDLVKSYIQAVENLDFQAMGTYLADSYIGLGPSYGDSIGKEDAIVNWNSSVENLYESIHYNRSKFASVTITDGPNKGEWVANWAELTIVYKNNRGSVTIWANTDYLIENGKIVRSLTLYNEADALRQLGYTIVPPAAAE
jgi:hypothetical protein